MLLFLIRVLSFFLWVPSWEAMGIDVGIDVPASVVRVKLVLTVSRAGVRAGSRPSANTSVDCDECVYCRDKPRLGGPGTKRQKCVLKRSPTAHVRLQVHAYPTTHDGFSAAPP